MNKIDTSQLLVQMRSMAAAAQGQGLAATSPLGSMSGLAESAGASPADFGVLLKQSLDGVNELKQTSSDLTNGYIAGDTSMSLAEVMIAKQKASIAFEATVQVRNKLLDAYKKVMAMQV